MTDDEGRPSPEAQAAIEDARRHRKATEAVVPVAERMAGELRKANVGNHFVDLLHDTLEAAARR